LAQQGYQKEQIREAGWVVQSVTGASAYLYSTDYDPAEFKKELERMKEHAAQTAGARR
jgi:hypothetical protein